MLAPPTRAIVATVTIASRSTITPHPESSFRINYGSGRVLATWILCFGGSCPGGGHFRTVIMSDALQQNFPASDFRLSLTGTVSDDQSLDNDDESGFARVCHVDVQLNNQAQGNGPAYTWCDDLFDPHNPFTNLVVLELVACGTVPNPPTPQTTPFVQ